MDLTKKIMSNEVEGVNYGETIIENQILTFKSHRLQKNIFQMKLDNISTAVIPTTNKDDVEIQFQETQEMNNNRDDHQLIQITFHFPSKKDQMPENNGENNNNDSSNINDEENEEMLESEAEKFHKLINTVGVLSSVTGDIIVEFTREQGNFVTPRGKYALQMTSTYVYMQGAQYFYKIGYNEINSLFLLPKLDGGRMAFVIALEKPIRQGNQKYQYLVIETHKLNATVRVNLTEEEIARDYEGQLQPEMDMPLCNLIAKVFKVLSQKSVFVPKHFVTTRGGHAVRCSLKANDGLLYPLAKAFIFINKPTVYIKFEDIEIIDFKRYDQNSNAATRNFDLVITLKSSAVSSNEPKEYNFSSIDRAEYPPLIEYFESKELPVNKPEEVNRRAVYEEDDDDDDDVKGGDGDSLDSEEEDDDYVGGEDDEEGGGDEDDDTSDASDDDDDTGASKSKKRKKSSSSKDVSKVKKKTSEKKTITTKTTTKTTKKSKSSDD